MFLCRLSRIAAWVWWMLVVRCSAVVLRIPLVQEVFGPDQMFLCRSSRIATWVWWMLVVRCSALVLGIPLVQEDVGLDQEITKNRLPRQVETFAPLWQQVMFPWLDIIYDIKNKIYKIFDSYKSPSKLVLSHKFHDEAAYKEQVKKNRKFLDDIGKRSVDAADGIAREHVFED